MGGLCQRREDDGYQVAGKQMIDWIGFNYIGGIDIIVLCCEKMSVCVCVCVLERMWWRWWSIVSSVAEREREITLI